MRALWFGLCLGLCGCPGALLLSAVASDGPKGYVHPPNAKDYESWVGVPKIELESHPRFSLLPREVRPLSDGSEMWFLRHCPRHAKPGDCCLYEFVLSSGSVSKYRTVGQCGVDCGMRPESKVEACMNAAMVPEGYGASAR